MGSVERDEAREERIRQEVGLTNRLDRPSATADLSPLDSHVSYRIDTPFGAEATAQSLLGILYAVRNDDWQLANPDWRIDETGKKEGAE